MWNILIIGTSDHLFRDRTLLAGIRCSRISLICFCRVAGGKIMEAVKSYSVLSLLSPLEETRARQEATANAVARVS